MFKKCLLLTVFFVLPSFAQTDLKVSLFGDMRFRHESVDSEKTVGKDQYDHLRLRARLGLRSQISETLNAELRLATGTGGTATNQTYSGTRNYDFKLDRAFAKYKPNEKVFVRLGRTDNPFVIAGDNNLLLDADMNFDGASVVYSHQAESLTYHLVLSHAVLTESSVTAVNAGVITNNVYDSKLDSAELAIRYAGDMHGALLTLTEHSFGNLKNSALLITGSSLGNSNTGGFYNYNYDVTAVGLEYSYKSEIPVTVFTEYANNNRTSKNDTALVYGIRLNKLKKKGDWMLTMDQREVEKDSTVGAFSDSDSFGGGTNGRSLNTSFIYGLEDNANFMLTYLTGETLIASGETSVDRNRIQADINIKF